MVLLINNITIAHKDITLLVFDTHTTHVKFTDTISKIFSSASLFN
jgi:hypothetical protein